MPLDTLQLFLLALPLMFLDWQLGLTWALIITNASLLSTLQAQTFSGFETWFLFLVVAFLRRWIFRS